ncbi:MAG: choice-of-anchor Q domain-containing protein, partial [Rubripirellula sp.]
ALYNGGAILNDLGPITISDSEITNNQAQYGDGGGVSNFAGSMTITRSTISANNSVTDGGGISNVSGKTIIRESTIDSNTAGGDGGGIATVTGGVTLTNSTISGNTGNVRGGGIQTDNAPIRLVNSTVTDNSSNISGGGIGTLNDGIFVGDNFGSISIQNSIVAENASPLGPDFVSPANPVANLRVNFSLIGNNKDTSLAASNGTGGNYIGTPTSPVDPALGPLANNGGTTRTHNPASTSIVVDGGSNALALDFGDDGVSGGGDDVTLENDQRGGLFSRIANASGSGATVDMGSVERQTRPILTVDTTSDESDGNLAPGDRSLRELIELANASEGFDTIVVPASIGSTITLDASLPPLTITESVSIVGPGADLIAIVGPSGTTKRLLDISSTAGSVSLSGLRFSGGDVSASTGAAGKGGAITSSSPGDLVLVGVELSGNSANSGGAIHVSAGSLSIAGSLVAENVSLQSGGGITLDGAATLLVLVNSTISTNSAGVDGGGVVSAAGVVSIESSTLTGNSAVVQGGAIRMATGSTTLAIDNSIVAANTAPIAPEFNSPQNPVANLDVDFSLIGDNAGTLLASTPVTDGQPVAGANGNFIGGSGTDAIDPELSPLMSQGGRLRVHLPLQSSVAIDNGSTVRLPLDSYDINGNGSRTEVLPVDVRSATRVVGDVDMGAVELAPIPTVTWDMPAGITFGDALSGTQLNAVSTAAGSFTYSPVSGTVLDAGASQRLTAVFTPNDPFAFRSVTVTTTIDVDKAEPAVTWATPAPIILGTLLSTDQLNATADVAGTFVYTPPLDTELALGDGQLLSVRFTPDDANYEEVTRTVLIDVVEEAVSDEDYGDAPTDYAVLLADDGARHTVGALRFGSELTADDDGQPSLAADADDDDGVTLLANPVAVSSVDTIASFLVTVSADAKLDAWIDFDADGSWDSTDQIATDLAVTSGDNVIAFTVPAGTLAGETFARFRLSSAGSLAPTGAAADGEVEDVRVEILDGDLQSDAIVTVVGGLGSVSIAGDDVTVGSGDDTLFEAPVTALTDLQIDGTDADDTFTLGVPSLSDSATLAINGSLGNNTLVVGASVDFTDPAVLVVENFAIVDLLTAGPQAIAIDADVVSAFSPSAESILVRANSAEDRLVFVDIADWRLDAPDTSGGGFAIVALNQVTGQVVRIDATSGWHNVIEPSDVNNNGSVTANDALVIINELGRRSYSDGDSSLLEDPATSDPFPGTYYDQNGDGRATALDALRVINQLARISNSGGELVAGEQIVAQLPALATSAIDKTSDIDFAFVSESGGDKIASFAADPSHGSADLTAATSEWSGATEAWADNVDQWLAELGVKTRF